jgi:hypothetical protein
MSYGEHGKYKSANIKTEKFDAAGAQHLLADAMERIGLNGFRHSGLSGTDAIEKEAAAEAAKSGISTIASPKAVEWTKKLCNENKKLKSLAQGFILALALKHSGMPYKITADMAGGKMPKAENAKKSGEMGFALSFGGNSENTVVKKISLMGTQEHEIGYFLTSVHNTSLRLLVRMKGIPISPMPKQKKDMKKLADGLKKLGKVNGIGGLISIITVCSSYDIMPFPVQRQFLKIYKDLPKPRRMEKFDQPIQSFIWASMNSRSL